MSFLDEYVESGRVKLVFSKEFISVSSRPKFAKYFTDEDIVNLLSVFNSLGVVVNVTSNIKTHRDIKDDFLLNLAIDSKANYVFIGDKDLLEIKNINKTIILSMTDLK